MPDSGRASAGPKEADVGDVGVAAAGDLSAAGVAGTGEPAVEVGVADVLAAQSRLRRYLPVTPMHHAERFGVMLKLENLQRTGSYKVRGALNAMLAARERGDHRPVICASAGNHAQGVAWAAYRLGVQAITVMPHGAPENKIAGVAHWGATVRQHGDSYDEAYAFARQLAGQNDYRFLSAFDDPDVIAGQGTIGIEIAAYAPDVVIVPIGGGGLASGMALALKAQGVRVVGAQVEGVDAMARAIRGDVRPIDPARSLADGVRVKVPGFITRRLCARLLDDVVIVREAELRETLVRLALEENLIAEGAGALALAAGRRVAGKRKCAVVSGGNIDAATLATLLSEVRPRPPRKPRRRTGGPEPAEPAEPAGQARVSGAPAGAAGPALRPDAATRKGPHVAKRRPAANLSPSPTIPVPTAPTAPQHVSEEEFTW